MSNILIIGAGGVSQVATVKCAMNADVFSKITLASRTKSKCDAIAKFIKDRLGVQIDTAQIDADDTDAVVNLIKKTGAELLLNVALPYQDLTLMDACSRAGIPYIDTANYEHPGAAKFEYKLQWAKDEDFKKVGTMALLGSGFEPARFGPGKAAAWQKPPGRYSVGIRYVGDATGLCSVVCSAANCPAVRQVC